MTNGFADLKPLYCPPHTQQYLIDVKRMFGPVKQPSRLWHTIKVLLGMVLWSRPWFRRTVYDFTVADAYVTYRETGKLPKYQRNIIRAITED